jgi:hypothetical protein
MREKPKDRRAVRRACATLSPQAAALMLRRVTLLLGFVPLTEMTQEETDWVFHQSRRGADDE